MILNQDICRTDFSGEFVDKIKSLRESAGPERLRMVNPIIYRSLKKSGRQGNITEGAFAQIEEEYYLTAVSNTKKLAAATRMLQVFESEGVPAVPVKGVAAIETIYRDPGLRPMADIDLLIKQEDAKKAKDILANKGYAYVDSYRGSIDFTDNEGEAFDLHSRFTRFDVLFHINYDEIYSRLTERNFNGQVWVGVLCPEHQLIHIALHLSPGLYSGLNFINLIDIYCLISGRGCPIDWEYLISFSTRSGMNSYIYGPIYLCEQLLNANIPGSVISILRSGLPKAKFSYLRDRYLESILGRGGPGLRILLERIKWAEGVPHKMKLLRMALFPDRDEMAQRYEVPEDSIRLYATYIDRIGRLLKQIIA